MNETMKKEILAGWNSVQNQNEDDWLIIELAMSKTKFYPDMGEGSNLTPFEFGVELWKRAQAWRP